MIKVRNERVVQTRPEALTRERSNVNDETLAPPDREPPLPPTSLIPVVVPVGAHPARAPAGPSRIEAPWSAHAKALAAAALHAAAGATGTEAVAAVVDFLLESKELKGSRLSCAVAVAGGPPLLRGTSEAVNPCSNAKLMTAAYALSVLGPMHRFPTEMLQAPSGALVVRGAFDPTLTTDDLVAMALALRQRGIERVPALIVDNTALKGGNVPRAFDKYGDEDWEYLARPEPLSVNKNALRLVVTPGTHAGAAAHIDIDNGAFAIHSKVSTVDAGATFRIGCDELDTAGVLRRDAHGKAIIEVWGDVAADYRKGKALVMKMPSPTEGFIDRLRFALHSAGIVVDGEVSEAPAPPGSVAVHTHKSKPLGEILQESLATSNAFDHEMFALAAAQRETGGPVSLADATARLESFVADSLGGVSVMANASGIGNENKLRCQDIVGLLQKAMREPRLAPLVPALATPGGKGTLRTRMLGTEAEGRLHAKTGTGEGACALSGVVGDVVFSLLVERTAAGRDAARAALDALGIALAALERSASARVPLLLTPELT